MRLMQMAAHRGADEASSLESSDTQSSVPGASRGEKQGLKKCHSQESRSAAPIDFVEGGLRGWMAVLGGCVVIIMLHMRESNIESVRTGP